MSWILAALGAGIGIWRLAEALQMLQQDSYNNGRYFRWVFAKPVPRWLLAGSKAESKKPLVWTGRAKRIYGVALAVIIIAAAALQAAGLVTAFLAPFAVVAANILLIPVQNAINEGFVRSARRKLAEIQPVVIGVAGSYGKTSTKYFIATILEEQYKVLRTPNSFNTKLGVCRVINETLAIEHQVFVVEMGAYQRGEVAETAELVRPRIGVVTSIGPEHFERFLSIENIQATNYEVIEPLPVDGAAIFNCDFPDCAVLADRTKHTRVFRYSIERRDVTLWAEEIVHSGDGLAFTMVHRDGRRQPARTKIVGRHNVQNILAAALVALDMGLTFDQIAAGIAKLEPAPHRLNIIRGAGGVVVIDDSYNSNPWGAAEALNVLAEFRTGRRMLVAPGMIELGTLQDEMNEKFGRQAAAVCDYIFLVGPAQTRAVAAGLKKAGYPESQYRVCQNLGEATAAMQAMVRPGDAVLFENDLPDLYSEK
jgi:UDP-N-acetylmuramoyl-tripeptide--D-alanyl-D-alanine ligase